MLLGESSVGYFPTGTQRNKPSRRDGGCGGRSRPGAHCPRAKVGAQGGTPRAGVRVGVVVGGALPGVRVERRAQCPRKGRRAPSPPTSPPPRVRVGVGAGAGSLRAAAGQGTPCDPAPRALGWRGVRPEPAGTPCPGPRLGPHPPCPARAGVGRTPGPRPRRALTVAAGRSGVEAAHRRWPGWCRRGAQGQGPGRVRGRRAEGPAEGAGSQGLR